jgi:magnesium chelatase subunit D
MVEFGGGKKPSPVGGEGFAAIVGQEPLKEALVTVATDAELDGLLIQGEKGTAKSTAVRALADALPRQRAVADCPYGCPPDAPAAQCSDCRERPDPSTAERDVPLVTVPLGATRERVVGSLSVADALDGDPQFEPGLLARANRGILYVDEVNLLDDHLVDVLLDAAASGVNRVERDGMSVTHPAAFTLIGTMNPEEGDLRPQLRDRFALQATVTGSDDLDERVAIVDRALDRGDHDPAGPDAATLRRRIAAARDRLPEVTLPDERARDVAELCRDAGADGHRGDIATARAAVALAAVDGRRTVTERDVRRAAELALPHRLRSRPFEDAPDPEDLIDDQFEDEADEEGDAERDTGDDGSSADESESELDAGETGDDGDGERESGSGKAENGGDDGDDAGERGDCEDSGVGEGRGGAGGDPLPSGGEGDSDASGESEGEPGDGGDEKSEEGTPLVPGQRRSPAEIGDGRAPDLSAPEAPDADDGSRTRAAPTRGDDGARVRTERARTDDAVDAGASLRAAARRGSDAVESRDLRQSVRTGESAALVLFVVDASASMRPAMRTAKGTVLELLKDAYRERDEVGMVTFAGDRSEVVLPPTDSVTLAARHLKDLPTGDRTPLPDGLRTAGEVLARADPAASVVVLVSDGRANVAEGSPTGETRTAARVLAETGARVVVVDAGDGDRAGLLDVVTETTDGERVPLSALSPERVTAAVTDAT